MVTGTLLPANPRNLSEMSKPQVCLESLPGQSGGSNVDWRKRGLPRPMLVVPRIVSESWCAIGARLFLDSRALKRMRRSIFLCNVTIKKKKRALKIRTDQASADVSEDKIVSNDSHQQYNFACILANDVS